jgi:hypothetical protein
VSQACENRSNVPLRADFLRDTGDLPRELSELVDHTVDNILKLNHDDTLHGHCDLLRQVSAGNGIANASDILNLGLE